MNQKTRAYVFIAFYVALAMVLRYITKFFPQMPNGGTLELENVAIFVASFHLGWKSGIATGVLTWCIGTMFGMNNFMVTPIQTVLDYIFPVMVVGMASIFPKIRLGKLRITNIYIGVTLGMILKYTCNMLAGVFFWFPEGSAAGSAAAWIYSAWTYNLAYNTLTLIACLIIVPVLIKALRSSRNEAFIGIKEFEVLGCDEVLEFES